MMLLKRVTLWLFVSGFLATVPMNAAALTITKIDSPGSTGPFGTQAYGINDAGLIVGITDTAGVFHGFLDDHGVFTSVDAPGAIHTEAFAINNAGVIAGTFVDNQGKFHGFLDNSGTFSSIDVPNTVRTEILGVNNAGEVVGDYTDSAGVKHGFVGAHGVFTTIDVPGAIQSIVTGLNNQGQLVGGYADKNGVTHGFLDDNGAFMTIDAPGFSTDTSLINTAWGINDAGQITGFVGFNPVGDEGHGFVLDHGTFTSILIPDTEDTAAHGINGSGQVVGLLDEEGGSTRGFLASPVPEPGPAVLFVVGSLFLGLVRRRRMI